MRYVSRCQHGRAVSAATDACPPCFKGWKFRQESQGRTVEPSEDGFGPCPDCAAMRPAGGMGGADVPKRSTLEYNADDAPKGKE